MTTPQATQTEVIPYEKQCVFVAKVQLLEWSEILYDRAEDRIGLEGR
jgi:hypothetical protein